MRGRRGAIVTATLLLVSQAVLSVHSLSQHCLTVDEGGHVLDGLLVWTRGTFGVYRVNPPLIKVLAALPVAASAPCVREPDPSTPANHWESASDRFLRDNSARLPELVSRARYVIVALAVWGGTLIYRWSRELFGTASALLALSLWVFCPNVLAWSGIATVDMGATVFGFAAVYTLRQYLLEPGKAAAVWAGFLMGLAALSKFTLLALYPAWCLIWLVRCFGDRRRDWSTNRAAGGTVSRLPRAREAHLILSLLVSLAVINGGYGFQGSCWALKDFEFRSRALAGPPGDAAVSNRFRRTWLEGWPVPLPAQFVLGLDDQKSQADEGFPAFLPDQWRYRGWGLDYLGVLAIKVPLGTWYLAILAALLALWSCRYRAALFDESLLWLPAGAIYALISSQTGANPHLRYILPAFPFALVGISRIGRLIPQSLDARPSRAPAPSDLCKYAHPSGDRRGAWSTTRASRSKCSLAMTLGAVTVIGAVAWNAVTLVRAHPHHLSYCNELAGGPDRGWEFLIESNFDWGQDLLFLKRWLEDHPEASALALAYYGGIDPNLVGLHCPAPPPGPPKGPDAVDEADAAGPSPRAGWFAVSVNVLRGMQCDTCDTAGIRAPIPRHTYDYFRFFKPVAKAGYSIFIYHISQEEADRARAMLASTPSAEG